jgi:hypothetical protein
MNFLEEFINELENSVRKTSQIDINAIKEELLNQLQAALSALGEGHTDKFPIALQQVNKLLGTGAGIHYNLIRHIQDLDTDFIFNSLEDVFNLLNTLEIDPNDPTSMNPTIDNTESYVPVILEIIDKVDDYLLEKTEQLNQLMMETPL